MEASPKEEATCKVVDLDVVQPEKGLEDLLPPSAGLTTQKAESLLAEYGPNELVEVHTPSWLVFLKQLYGPMPFALWLAVIVEFALKNYPDGGILLFILLANATIGWYETVKASNAVEALKKGLKPRAVVKRDGAWANIPASELVPGDLVKLVAGSGVPADCSINEGVVEVDQSQLTGETMPVAMGVDSVAKMGSTVARGEVEATVQFTGMSTFFGRTAALIQSVESGLGHIHKVLVRVMLILCSLSIVLCVTAFGYLMGYDGISFKEAIEFTVVLLIVSIPLAIEIVVTTTLALGSKELSQHKVIVTRLASIEELSGVNVLCSDKTGTLTQNKMEIQDDCYTFRQGEDKESLLVLCALAAKWREPPKDALDTMILGAANLDTCDKYTQEDYIPFDPKRKRTEATLTDSEGRKFKITKGAPQVILALSANQADVHDEVTRIIEELGPRGIRCLAVARTEPGSLDFCFTGILTFLDPPRPDSKTTIARAKEFGVSVKMITGDQLVVAKETARQLGMGDAFISAAGANLPLLDPKHSIPTDLGEKWGDLLMSQDGFAQVYPEHKYMIVEALRQKGFTCAMTGDGVNDAPALKRADVGVAVSGATDAARAAADMILVEEGLSVIIEAIIIARGVFRKMVSFLMYRVAATLQLLFFFFIAVFALPPNHYQGEWPAYFNVPVIQLMLITLLNDGTLMTIGYDRTPECPKPQIWNLRVLFLVASVLASVACLSSLLLLWSALDSHSTSGVFHAWGLPGMEYGQIVTMMYLKISISDFLTLFSSRTQGSFFFTHRPSWVLVVGALLALGVSTIVATTWPKGSVDNIPVEGLARNSTYRLWPLWVWVYCLVWWSIQEVAKVGVFKLIDHFDVFSYRSEQQTVTLPSHEPAASEVSISMVTATPKHTPLKMDSHLLRKSTEVMWHIEEHPLA